MADQLPDDAVVDSVRRRTHPFRGDALTGLLARVPAKITTRLDDWRFWTGVAYFALAFLMVWLYVVNSRTIREEATRRATELAAMQAAYRQCLGSIPSLNKINTHLRGVNDLAETLTLNSLAVASTTPKGDPQYRTRRANLARLQAARAKIGAVAELPVPTRKQCRERLRAQ